MVRAIVGANWGDEGKGKITDMLAKESDIIIRFQGGSTEPRDFNMMLRTHLGPVEDENSLHYLRSEERRVGKECRSRWSPYH